MKKYLFVFFFGASSLHGMLAGGRPNTFSGGNNAFAGVINPANAVWIKDRFDIGTFLVHQKSSFTNLDNNPLFSKGKLDLTYKSKNLWSLDFAFLKNFKFDFGSKSIASSFTFAVYRVPSSLRLQTKNPVPSIGTTPIALSRDTEVISLIFSVKPCKAHSFGVSFDYIKLSLLRNGFQNSATPSRSIAPFAVTNRGVDHSSGFGLSLGWRWNITERLNFGAAWIKKAYCGRFEKYKGFEPYRGKNDIPQTLGGGFSYFFTKKLAGRLETLWSNLNSLPGANNTVFPNGTLNRNKRGSSRSAGPGLQDAVYINTGLGYQYNEVIAVGAGFSHRIKWARNSPYILSHSYSQQTIYDILSLGSIINYKKHQIFLIYSYGFRNQESGLMPKILGGGRFLSERQTMSFSLSWGYKYWN